MLVAAHRDGSYAGVVGEGLSEEIDTIVIANAPADEAGGGAGGSDRLAGGAMDMPGDGCRRVQGCYRGRMRLTSREASGCIRNTRLSVKAMPLNRCYY